MPQKMRFIPEQQGAQIRFWRMAEAVKGLAQQREQVSSFLLAGYRTRREVAQISGDHNVPPALP